MRILTPTLLGVLALTLWAPAQDDAAKYQKKLEKEFVGKIEWVKTLADAQTQAKEKQSLIYAYFTRSYAP